MRAMRIVVMFDLPTGSAEERRTYGKFRKFLLSDGYIMEQFSVYTRVTLGRDNLDTHIARLREHLPEAGRVTVITMTDKQYSSRMVLVCGEDYEPELDDIGSGLTLVF